MILKGKAWKFGDGISTDHIQPSRYFHLRSNLPELAKHVLEGAREDFPSRFAPGDFVVGGRNFGLGSSREHAPTIIKMAGLSAVLAKSFARIFFRNAINVGLPILESPAAVSGVEAGQQLEIDLEAGQIRNLTTGQVYQAEPYPPFMMDIIRAGGLVPYTRQRGSGSGIRNS
jgi:3-isopropylmalate/(R)-2-methylmalate dehydratase small subunit